MPACPGEAAGAAPVPAQQVMQQMNEGLLSWEVALWNAAVPACTREAAAVAVAPPAGGESGDAWTKELAIGLAAAHSP